MYKNIIILMWSLIASIVIDASDDESDYVIVPSSILVSRSKSNNNFMSLIPANNLDSVIRQTSCNSDSDVEKITGEDFKDAGDRVKEYDDAIYQKNRKTLMQTAHLGYLGNLCGVCAMVPGTGPLSFIPTAIGSVAGVLAFKIARQNKWSNAKLQKEINEAIKARDCGVAQNIDFQPTSLSSIEDSKFDEKL